MPWGMNPNQIKWFDKWAQYKAERIACYWCARAIFEGYDKFHIIGDRQDFVGGNDEERKELGEWIDTKGFKELTKLLRDARLTTSDDADVRLETEDGFYVYASPRKSYGYLYISMWKVPVVKFPDNF